MLRFVGVKVHHLLCLSLQMVHGVHGLKPSEPVIDFISKYYTHFTGGVFWVNCSSSEFIRAAEHLIDEVSGKKYNFSELQLRE